ncbi:hypothetical protein N8J89_14020 [Crossiella sp. CA-258035]|uniref:hypothetical protein n=1 Tax=Crossiella sp. CA-258035 TaxID=2981138 RepID=UPI0024BC0339|nr:hypothetical protein [Crossiella sp. CA-258035]WHT22133.1 hypothetical protein N8J89_14020 [Crossiella sp. CA-258035]
MAVVADTILSTAEAQWLAARFDATQWAREPAADDPPLHINIDARDNYVARRVDAEACAEALSKPWREMSDQAASSPR